MSYNNLLNAIARAELAGQTFKSVATKNDEFVTVGSNDYMTLYHRITTLLDAEVINYKGEDGISIEDVYLDGRDLYVLYEDGNLDTFPDFVPEDAVSIENYFIMDGDVYEEKSNGDLTNLATLDVKDGVSITNVEILDSGFIDLTFSDGSTQQIGKIDSLGGIPFESSMVKNDKLYIQFNNGLVKEIKTTDDEEIRIKGDDGQDGNMFVSVDQYRVPDTRDVYFRFNMDDGTTFPATGAGIGPALLDVRLAANEDLLTYDINTDRELTFYLPEVGAIMLGNIDGADGTDADDGKTIEHAEMQNEGTELHIEITDGMLTKVTGTPKQVVVPATNTVIKSYNVNDDGNLIFEIGTEEDGSVKVNVGRVKGSDGLKIVDMSVSDDNDVIMTVDDNGTTNDVVIGNITYDRVVSVRTLTDGRLEFTTLLNNKIETTESINGIDKPVMDDGTTIRNIAFKDEGKEFHVTLSGGSSRNIGSPEQVFIDATNTEINTYTITDNNELVFDVKLDETTTKKVNVGKVRGKDGIDTTVTINSGGDITVSQDDNGKVTDSVIGNMAYETLDTSTVDGNGTIIFTTNKGNTIPVNGDPTGDDANDGSDGITITKAEFNSSGSLYNVEFSRDTAPLQLVPEQVNVDDPEIDIISSTITSNNELVITFSNVVTGQFVDNIGVINTDGDSIKDIFVNDKDQIVVTYERVGVMVDEVVGRLDYDIINRVSNDPVKGLTFTTRQNNEIVVSGKINGTEGNVGTIVDTIDHDANNEMSLSLTLTNGKELNDIVKVRPMRSHSVVRNTTTDSIVFTFDDNSETSFDTLVGDPAHNVTGASIVDNKFVINFDDGETLSTTETIPVINSLNYDDANSLLKFGYDDTEVYDVVYPTPSDGAHGVWVTEANELSNGELRLKYSDGSSKKVGGGSINARWPVEFYEQEGEFYLQYNDETDPTLIKTMTMDGTDGEYITDMTYDIGQATVVWNDENKADTVVPMDINLWPIDAYNDGDDIYVHYNVNEDATKIGTIPDFEGKDGKWVIETRENLAGNLVIKWGDETEETVGSINGVDGAWPLSFYRTADTLNSTWANKDDQSHGDITLIDGINSVWPTAMVENADGKLEITFSDSDTETLPEPINGVDGDILYSMTEDSNGQLELTYFDNTTETLPEPINGTDGDILSAMVETSGGQLELTYFDSTTEILPEPINGTDGDILYDMSKNMLGELELTYYDTSVTTMRKIDGENFDNEIDTIELFEDGIKSTMLDGSVFQSDIINSRLVDSKMENDILEIEFNDLGVINLGAVNGEDVPDGVYITNLYVENQELKADYSDGTTGVFISDFNRADFKDASIEETVFGEGANNLSITLTDGTTIDNGRVVGTGGDTNVVDGLINIDGQLVLTMSNDNVIRTTDRVQGEHGNGVVSVVINTDGNLIFNMEDETTINGGFVLQDLGFAEYSPVKEYDRGTSCTFDGNIYVALTDGVSSAPSPENSQWARVRLEGDGNSPDASRPDIVSPKDDEVHPYEQPYLLGGPLRAYYSNDTRLKRVFQIDTIDNNFLNPVYSGEESSDGHQADITLTVGTEYKWRCRDFIKETGYFTDWSLEGTFTVSENVIQQPTVTIGTSYDVNSVELPALFNGDSFNGTGTHTSSIWEVKDNSNDEIVYSEEVTSGLTTFTMPFGYLFESKDYSVRVKYVTSTDESPYSLWFSFTTVDKFQLNFTPEIMFDGDDVNATVAKPAFKVAGFVVDYYETFMDSEDLVVVWEVRDTSNNVVWTTENMHDITQVRVGEILTSGVNYKIRMKYFSDRFFGESDWSNEVTFTPVWDIQKPTVTTPYDVTEYPTDALFESDAFVSNSGEKHFGTLWEIRENGEVVYTTYKSFDLLYEWEYFFRGRDSLKQYDVVAKYIGRYGESEYSDPLSITLMEIIEVSVYATSADQTVRRIDKFGVDVWVSNEHTAVTNKVGVDDIRQAYSVSDDNSLIKFDENGQPLWTYDAGETLTSVDSYDENTLYVGTTSGKLIKIDNTGEVTWEVEAHTSSINDIHIGSSGYVYTASSDNLVKKYDWEGNMVWEFSGHSNNVLAVVSDIDGNVYSGSSDNTVRKMDDKGKQVWSFTGHTNNINDVAVNENYNVFTASSDGNVKMIDSTGSEVWNYSHGSAVNAVDCDYENNSYIGTNDNLIKMIDDQGGDVWEYNKNSDSITDVTINEIPLLMTPISLAGRYYNLVAPENLVAF